MAVWTKKRGAKWYVYYHLPTTHDEKRRCVKAKVIGTDKREAEQVALYVKKQLATGQLSMETLTPKTNQSESFEQYAWKWFSVHSPYDRDGNIRNIAWEDDNLHWKPSTSDRYKDILSNYLIPGFRGKDLNQITKVDAKRFFIELLNGKLHPNTVKTYYSVLRALLSEAFEDERITVNPVIGLSKLFRNKRNEKPESDCFFAHDEVTKLLQTALVHFSNYYPMILCASRTGMRLGELIALKWDDIDFNKRFVNVNQSDYRGIEALTKSRRSRQVDISNQLYETLVLWKAKQSQLFQSWKEASPVYVFTTETGCKINPNHFRDLVWKKCLELAGIRYIKFHALRHTFASLLLQKGESPVYVQKQLGHHSIDQTVGTYGHLIPGDNRSAVNKLDDTELVYRERPNLAVVN